MTMEGLDNTQVRVVAFYILSSVSALVGVGTIWVTEDAETPFSVIAVQKLYADGSALRKLFSSKPLSKEVLLELFLTHEVSQRACMQSKQTS